MGCMKTYIVFIDTRAFKKNQKGLQVVVPELLWNLHHWHTQNSTGQGPERSSVKVKSNRGAHPNDS